MGVKIGSNTEVDQIKPLGKFDIAKFEIPKKSNPEESCNSKKKKRFKRRLIAIKGAVARTKPDGKSVGLKTWLKEELVGKKRNPPFPLLSIMRTEDGHS